MNMECMKRSARKTAERSKQSKENDINNGNGKNKQNKNVTILSVTKLQRTNIIGKSYGKTLLPHPSQEAGGPQVLYITHILGFFSNVLISCTYFFPLLFHLFIILFAI